MVAMDQATQNQLKPHFVGRKAVIVVASASASPRRHSATSALYGGASRLTSAR